MGKSWFGGKRAVVCYGGFGVASLILACIWYAADWGNCVQAVAFAIYICFTGALQFLMFRFYLDIGKEREFERENQVIRMNHRLLECQMEMMEQSLGLGRRLCHDIRHHNAVIAEYVRRGQKEELLQFLKEYDKETDQGITEVICDNTAVNNVLSAYTRKARNEQIRVSLNVEIGRNLAISDIDLVAILAYAYENAIYDCMEVKRYSGGRECTIHFLIKRRENKLVIFCSNTCRVEAELMNRQTQAAFMGGAGIQGMIRTAEKYDGEYDFANDNGVFVFRLIMSIPPDQ